MPRLLAPIINPDDIVDKQYVDSVASAWNTVTITSNYTANNLDRIFANTTSGAITVTVPDSGTFSVVDLIGNTPTTGFFTNNLTINPTAGQTIMGASSFVLNVGAITVVFELFGTDWRLIN
jgi:hypothetical protein